MVVPAICAPGAHIASCQMKQARASSKQPCCAVLCFAAGSATARSTVGLCKVNQARVTPGMGAVRFWSAALLPDLVVECLQAAQGCIQVLACAVILILTAQQQEKCKAGLWALRQRGTLGEGAGARGGPF